MRVAKYQVDRVLRRRSGPVKPLRVERAHAVRIFRQVRSKVHRWVEEVLTRRFQCIDAFEEIYFFQGGVFQSQNRGNLAYLLGSEKLV